MDGDAHGPTASVLLVCTANLARSPLAAAILGEPLADRGIVVSSAGTHATPGLPAAEASRRLAAKRGLDLSGHRSRPITPELVAGSDLVIGMTEDHRDACAVLGGGGTAERTFTLRELARLVQELDVAACPLDPAARIRWLRREAHLGRPVLPRPRRREDIADPLGRCAGVWRRLEDDLDQLLPSVAAALAGR